MSRRVPHLADERGQTFIEWLGAMVLIIALVGLVLAVVPGVASSIGDAVKHLIDSVTS